ncbi:MAG: radical SAM protein, partial [Magnetococcales bacterium]|nr:radical SAM protein [Magnetococcales bacterium]
MLKIIQEEQITVVGTGGLSMTMDRIDEILTEVHKYDPNIITVLGGGIITADPETVYCHLQPNFGVIGEGEEVMKELLLAIHNKESDYTTIPGIVFNHQGTIKNSGERTPIADLDRMPLPDIEGFGIKEFLEMQDDDVFDYHLTINGQGKSLPIMASRSCPYKCTFCFHTTSQVYRKISIKRVVDEILRLKEKYQVYSFDIYDDLFDYDKNRIKEFCQLLLDSDANITWMCQLRVNNTNQELLYIMKEAGCTCISYGFESASPTTLKSMKKRICPQDIAKSVKYTRNAGIAIQANFLFGDPADTIETVQETLDFQNQHNLDYIDWSAVIPYPGSPLCKKFQRSGIIPGTIEFTKLISNSATYLWKTLQPPVNMTQMPDAEFRKLYLELREITDKNNRKRLAEICNFQYITDNLSHATIKCPCCKKEQLYKVRYPPDSTGETLTPAQPLFGLRGINIRCAICSRRMHMPPWFFPHIDTMYSTFQTLINNLTQTKEEVVLLPAMDRYFGTFSERVDISRLNVVATMDTIPYRLGQLFFDREVEELSNQKVVENKESVFVILPAYNSETLLNVLREAGIKQEKIIYWPDCYQPT